ncbi:MAG: class I SAM-dependent methyltransferase [Myxococcota bacterium]|nr:class I SAM-dependent methyltransferase [Myxococcota bacterium]
MSRSNAPSADDLKAYSFKAFATLQGAVTAAMIHLGDRLDLYRSLADGEPVDAAALAARTGLSERWLREWLYNQGAAGLLDAHPGERFALSPAGHAVLADENHPAFGAGMFQQLPELMGVLPRLGESFRSGIGLPYDAFGPEGAQGVERGFAPWYRNFLVPALRSIEGVPERLEAGGRVADVGCGGGVALIQLASAFPEAELHGFDLSRHAIERARANREEAGVSSVTFHLADEEPLPDDGRFDLVLTFDCLHDMTDPAGVMRAIRAAIAPDGVWVIADIKSQPTYEANAEKNPMAAMMYGVSVLSCMSSALSEPGGAGLGTLGFHEPLAREMTSAAGFTRFRRLEIEHPINAFYEVRP